MHRSLQSYFLKATLKEILLEMSFLFKRSLETITESSFSCGDVAMPCRLPVDVALLGVPAQLQHGPIATCGSVIRGCGQGRIYKCTETPIELNRNFLVFWSVSPLRMSSAFLNIQEYGKISNAEICAAFSELHCSCTKSDDLLRKLLSPLLDDNMTHTAEMSLLKFLTVSGLSLVSILLNA